MMAKKLLGALLATGLGLVAVMNTTDATAQTGKAKEANAGRATSEPPLSKKQISLPLAGITWGQSPNQVARVVDKLIDEDYRPAYKDVQPGVKMKALDGQVAEEKNEFRRTRIDFGKTPTGIDSTPLRGEYTYQNKETMLTLNRKGGTTYFFFIQDKLWKMIVEHTLGDGAPLGKSYQDAVVKFAGTFGIGRVLLPEGNRFATEVDWKDATTHLRAIERNDTAMAIGFEANAAVANLKNLRPNKPAEEPGLDPDVARAIRGGSSDPEPPPDKKGDAKPKK